MLTFGAQHDDMENMRIKFGAVALATSVALGVGISAATPADAQTDPVETQDRADMRTDRMQQREERLQAKVDEGVITQERADEIRARVAERAAQHEARQVDRAERAEELAATLGITVDELKTELRAGTSLADVAVEAGIDVDVLIDQIETQMTDRINQAVTDGRLDEALADQRLETLRDNITARVNGERPEGRQGQGPGQRGFGRHNRGGN